MTRLSDEQEVTTADMLEIVASGGNGSDLVDLSPLLQKAARELREKDARIARFQAITGMVISIIDMSLKKSGAQGGGIVTVAENGTLALTPFKAGESLTASPFTFGGRGTYAVVPDGLAVIGGGGGGGGGISRSALYGGETIETRTGTSRPAVPTTEGGTMPPKTSAH